MFNLLGQKMTNSVIMIALCSLLLLACAKPDQSILVKEGDDYVGVVTDADFTRKVAAESLDPKSTKISEIMSTPLFTLDASLPMIDANEQMGEKGVRHVSITENGKIVGMVTAPGLLAYYLKMFRFMQ